MKISHKMITLGLAFSLFGSTCALARPMPHFKNGDLSYENPMAMNHGSRMTSAASDHARPPSHAVQDDWPADMILD
jgi:hypothetical protein